MATLGFRRSKWDGVCGSALWREHGKLAQKTPSWFVRFSLRNIDSQISVRLNAAGPWLHLGRVRRQLEDGHPQV